jgi:hypothetical protein
MVEKFQAEAGLVSLVALLVLLGVIIVRSFILSRYLYADIYSPTQRNYRRNLINPPPRPWRLFRGNIDVLMVRINHWHTTEQASQL